MDLESEVISIIVPIYNVDNYLERCINSLLSQTYRNLEIILVDDGSTDKSGMICDRYTEIDKRIKVVHKGNGGLSDARNLGICISTGNFLSFVDSDDWIEKEMIETMYNKIVENEADIAICRRFRAYQGGAKQIEVFKTYPKTDFFDRKTGLKYLMSFCGYDMSVCDKLFKKSCLENIEFPYGKTCEDSYTTYKIFSQSDKVVYINKGLYNYFYRENSITRNSVVNETVIEATYEQMKFIRDKFPELIPEASSSYITAMVSVLNEYIKRKMKWDSYKKYKSEALKYLKNALKNKNISLSKKLQLILFCISSTIYEKFYKYVKNK